MMTIADRRAVMTAALQSDFRDLLREDPRGAVARATNRTAPEDLSITLIEEQADAWEFVVPADLGDAELPAPNDIRDAVENDVYAILRTEPEARARALGAPKAFLTDRLNIDLGDTGVNVHEERAGELIVILPNRQRREELHDDALDLVSGGGGGQDKRALGPPGTM